MLIIFVKYYSNHAIDYKSVPPIQKPESRRVLRLVAWIEWSMRKIDAGQANNDES